MALGGLEHETFCLKLSPCYFRQDFKYRDIMSRHVIYQSLELLSLFPIIISELNCFFPHDQCRPCYQLISLHLRCMLTLHRIGSSHRERLDWSKLLQATFGINNTGLLLYNRSLLANTYTRSLMESRPLIVPTCQNSTVHESLSGNEALFSSWDTYCWYNRRFLAHIISIQVSCEWTFNERKSRSLA